MERVIVITAFDILGFFFCAPIVPLNNKIVDTSLPRHATNVCKQQMFSLFYHKVLLVISQLVFPRGFSQINTCSTSACCLSGVVSVLVFYPSKIECTAEITAG